MEHTDVLVVGGGQAGIAMSEHLRHLDIPHVVLERARIAESWRTARWDSLVANGPAWHDRFPGMEFSESGPDEFAPKDEVAAYFAAYAEKFDLPVRCGVEVRRVTRREGRFGFDVETSQGPMTADYIVAATGPFQCPVIPPFVPADVGVFQIHSHGYRNPEQMPDGAILVVGAGSSGTQIADELNRAGRKVFLSVGPHERPPRRYRGRDNVWWLGVTGKWDAPAPQVGAEHVTIAVSGARGGETIDFRQLAEQGITLLGRAEAFEAGTMSFAPDLAANLAAGDASYLAILNEADAYIARNGLDLPEEPEARVIGPDPDCVRDPILSLNLVEEGINSIIWATGYSTDYGWLKVDAFDETGKPDQQRGISREPGVYFLGLPFLSRRGSSFIWGVWHDARFLADQIAIQRGYRSHQPDAHGRTTTD